MFPVFPVSPAYLLLSVKCHRICVLIVHGMRDLALI